MSKDKGTTIAVVKVFATIILGVSALVIGSVSGDIASTSTAAPVANSELDLRLVFYGYPKQGVPQSGTAVISATGLSDIHDITFTRLGGELSPNGRYIAYDNCANPSRGIYLAEPGGTNARMVVPLKDKYCGHIRWSPDSAKLSYISGPDRSLRIYDIGSESDSLIPDTQDVDWHWWSPDGIEIVYGTRGRRNHVGPVGRLLQITDLTGNGRPLTFAQDFMPCKRDGNLVDTWAPAWSPTGATIAFTQCERLFVISPTGHDLRQLTAPLHDVSRRSPGRVMTTAYSPRWSPDGRWIIFIGDGEILKRISADGNTIVDIGKLPYRGGPFSIAPLSDR